MIKTNPFKHIKTLVLCVLVMFTSCKNNDSKNEKNMVDNVLLQEWTGPYSGVPAFDKMNVEDIKKAVQKGMELSLADTEEIALLHVCRSCPLALSMRSHRSDCVVGS